jgi:hypothetical protein
METQGMYNSQWSEDIHLNKFSRKDEGSLLFSATQERLAKVKTAVLKIGTLKINFKG